MSVATIVPLGEPDRGRERLERARRSLLQVERNVGVTPVSHSLTGRIWHSLEGNAALFRALVSVTKKGQWVGFLGLDNAGWCAAEEEGIDLHRTLIVPDPSPSPARALAAMIDGLDLVVCGNIDIPRSTYRPIAGRVRARNCLLFTTRAWVGVSQPWFEHATQPLRHVEAV